MVIFFDVNTFFVDLVDEAIIICLKSKRQWRQRIVPPLSYFVNPKIPKIKNRHNQLVGRSTLSRARRAPPDRDRPAQRKYYIYPK